VTLCWRNFTFNCDFPRKVCFAWGYCIKCVHKRMDLCNWWTDFWAVFRAVLYIDLDHQEELWFIRSRKWRVLCMYWIWGEFVETRALSSANFGPWILNNDHDGKGILKEAYHVIHTSSPHHRFSGISKVSSTLEHFAIFERLKLHFSIYKWFILRALGTEKSLSRLKFARKEPIV